MNSILDDFTKEEYDLVKERFLQTEERPLEVALENLVDIWIVLHLMRRKPYPASIKRVLMNDLCPIKLEYTNFDNMPPILDDVDQIDDNKDFIYANTYHPMWDKQLFHISSKKIASMLLITYPDRYIPYTSNRKSFLVGMM